MIKLGDEVVDSITGFNGVAYGKTDYLNGCSRIAVQSRELKDGKPVELQWIDEAQLASCLPDEGQEERVTVGVEPTGGPQSNPMTNNNPK